MTYAVIVLSRKQTQSISEDWVKVKRVFRYLKGTINLRLKYTGTGDKLECYVDTSLGLSDEERKSISSLIVKMFNDVILWRTKKQTHMALSSAEAEYIAISLGAGEIVRVPEMCRRLIKWETTPIMYEDNNAAINIAKSHDSQS